MLLRRLTMGQYLCGFMMDGKRLRMIMVRLYVTSSHARAWTVPSFEKLWPWSVEMFFLLISDARAGFEPTRLVVSLHDGGRWWETVTGTKGKKS